MKTKTIWVVLIVVAVVAAVLVLNNRTQSGGGGPTQTQAQAVQLGAVLPLTGEVAAYGTGSKAGIELAVEEANKAQSNYLFEVTYEDSKGDPKTALSALQYLLATKKPVALIGENTSSATLAMVPVIDAAKIALVSPSASAPSLAGMSRYFFRVFPSDTEEGAFVCNAIKEQVPDAKVCVVYVNNDYGVGLKDVFLSVAKERGVTVLDNFGYDKGTTDFSPILARVKALEPNVIYLPSYSI
jgi:branched-chain amino acid transport system substrate-binding protein